jgi:integrase
LPEYLRPIVAAGFYLGCRLGELQQIKWDQVDFTRKEIVLYGEQTKNKQGRELPLYGELLEILKEERQSSPKCPWVFHRGGLPIGDFRKAWATACKLAGVQILFHDLRRSAARNMEAAGISRIRAKRITGHKTDSVFERYAGVFGSKDTAEAGERMERFFEEKAAVKRVEKIN